MFFRTVGIAAAFIALNGCVAEIPNCDPVKGACPAASELRLNAIVTVGTHNSYKQAINHKLFAYLMTQAPKIAPAHVSLSGSA